MSYLDKILENIQELASGDKIKVKKKFKTIGHSKTSTKANKIKPGYYEVVERWEDGILIKDKNNNRYFISNNKLELIEKE